MSKEKISEGGADDCAQQAPVKNAAGESSQEQTAHSVAPAAGHSPSRSSQARIRGNTPHARAAAVKERAQAALARRRQGEDRKVPSMVAHLERSAKVWTAKAKVWTAKAKVWTAKAKVWTTKEKAESEAVDKLLGYEIKQAHMHEVRADAAEAHTLQAGQEALVHCENFRAEAERAKMLGVSVVLVEEIKAAEQAAQGQVEDRPPLGSGRLPAPGHVEVEASALQQEELQAVREELRAEETHARRLAEELDSVHAEVEDRSPSGSGRRPAAEQEAEDVAASQQVVLQVVRNGISAFEMHAHGLAEAFGSVQRKEEEAVAGRRQDALVVGSLTKELVTANAKLQIEQEEARAARSAHVQEEVNKLEGRIAGQAAEREAVQKLLLFQARRAEAEELAACQDRMEALEHVHSVEDAAERQCSAHEGRIIAWTKELKAAEQAAQEAASTPSGSGLSPAVVQELQDCSVYQCDALMYEVQVPEELQEDSRELIGCETQTARLAEELDRHHAECARWMAEANAETERARDAEALMRLAVQALRSEEETAGTLEQQSCLCWSSLEQTRGCSTPSGFGEPPSQGCLGLDGIKKNPADQGFPGTAVRTPIRALETVQTKMLEKLEDFEVDELLAGDEESKQLSAKNDGESPQ